MLFEPFCLKNVRLANRLVRSATCEKLADEAGAVTDELVALYRALSAGGVGMIVTGHLYVRRDGAVSPGMTAVDNEACVTGLARLVEAVGAGGGAALVGQINHGLCDVRDKPARRIGPSAVAVDKNPPPRALRTAEVHDLIDAFVAAAVRLQRAGFDGVQVHAAHGYLLSRFLSPVANTRDDEFGGSVENRCRIVRRIVEGIRAALGAEALVAVKLGTFDELPGGLTLPEAVEVARHLVAAGADAIEASGGVNAVSVKPRIESPADEAYLLHCAEAVRKAVPVPVISVGGYRSRATMEAALQEGRADLIALSRPLVRQIDLPARMAEGTAERSECISCNGCLISRKPLACRYA